MASLTPQAPPSMALTAYDASQPSQGERRVHLDDLSGVLALAVLLGFVYSVKALRRKDLSLATFTHTLCMCVIISVGGHFLEEHVVGPQRAEALLRFGFAGFGTRGPRVSAACLLFECAPRLLTACLPARPPPRPRPPQAPRRCPGACRRGTGTPS